MGALGVRAVSSELAARGFDPRELERYSASNKLWMTKIKRLRLPDLFCVRTGLRVEVRAKSDLKIRMSDAPGNPDRAWDAGLRAEDLVALIACPNGFDGQPIPAERAVFLSVRDLRNSIDQSILGPPKSASEGAERDRTWPATVPRRPGMVLSVNENRLAVSVERDGAPARRQTYNLEGRHAYVARGDRFPADVTILAGAPRSLANLERYLAWTYDPLTQLLSNDTLDRFAACKALRFRPDLHAQGVPLLEHLIAHEDERRIRLELAATAAALGVARGQDVLAETLWTGPADLSMEAILILTELKSAFAHAELSRATQAFAGDERRQAAIWGLGKMGLKSYSDLIPIISDAEENAAYHAIIAFGRDTPRAAIDQLVAFLVAGEVRQAAAASEALRVIGSEEVLNSLVQTIADRPDDHNDWLVATLGRLPANLVRHRLHGSPLMARLEPLLLVGGENWLATGDAMANLTFLAKQDL